MFSQSWLDAEYVIDAEYADRRICRSPNITNAEYVIAVYVCAEYVIAENVHRRNRLASM